MPNEAKKNDSPGWGEVDMPGATFEPGKPENKDSDKWRQKLESRQDKLRYLQSAERYWYGGGEGFGSEKRKNPA